MRLATDLKPHSLVQSVLALTFVSALPLLAYGFQSPGHCVEFERTIAATYTFRPALLSEAEKTQKSAAMDVVWKTVTSRQRELLPCLRKTLEDPRADPWFRFDGSNLLVSLDPSPASKALLIKNYAASNLDDVDLRRWVARLAMLGAEGFDVSEAGAKWLSYANAEYYLPEHGAYRVDRFMGALFIFGSMDETQATPVLQKIVLDENKDQASRAQALAILLFQATPEALQAIKVTSELRPEQESLFKLIKNAPRLKPRSKPKTSREEFLRAFNAYMGGDGKPFAALVSEVPDGERDVVAVLKREDVPLVRRMRRKMIANSNQHAFEFYRTFTDILMTMVIPPEVVK